MDQISAEDVKKALDNKGNFVLLDVRTTSEYSRGKISGSINLPVDEVFQKIEAIVPDKTQTVYVYCLSGSRSVYAVDMMVKLGYKKVYDMPNGLLAWRVKGYPTV
jgi:rhodanese-related sulfurtransferase